jgi:hypothetical protein
MIVNIIQVITSAIIGALVSYLLGWMLPERPTRRNIFSILVAIAFFAGMSTFDEQNFSHHILGIPPPLSTEIPPTKTSPPSAHHSTPSGSPNSISQEIIIEADVEKNRTGIEVKQGQTVVIEFIEGKWRAGPLPTWPFYGPSGDTQVPSKETFPIQTKPIMGLVGYIGETSPFWIGAQIEFISSSNGELILGANDDSFDDNDGYLIVRVTVTK